MGTGSSELRIETGDVSRTSSIHFTDVMKSQESVDYDRSSELLQTFVTKLKQGNNSPMAHSIVGEYNMATKDNHVAVNEQSSASLEGVRLSKGVRDSTGSSESKRDAQSLSLNPYSLELGSRLGQGRESEVFSSVFMNRPVAVKLLRLGSTPAILAPIQSNMMASPLQHKLTSLHPVPNASPQVRQVRKVTIERKTTTAMSVRSDKFGLDAKSAMKAFSNEVALLMGLKHRNLIEFLGFGCNEGRNFIIIELATKGTLFDILSSKQPISAKLKRKLMLQTSSGMAYLHQCHPPIIHQDLKSLNLLLSDDWSIKIADFGIAQEVTHLSLLRSVWYSTQSSDTSNVTSSTFSVSNTEEGQGHGGTLQWMPPELIVAKDICLSTKIDVFSFAVVLWEVCSRKRPWNGINTRIISDSVVSGGRLPKSESWPIEVRMLIDKCWAHDPSQRPEFRSIKSELKEIRFPEDAHK